MTDDVAKAIARQLESRGIAKVPGLPDDEPEPEWFDIAIELEKQNKLLEDEREVRCDAEEEAENAPKTTADIFCQAIKGSSSKAMPLNGAGILRSALAGGPGTINRRDE